MWYFSPCSSVVGTTNASYRGMETTTKKRKEKRVKVVIRGTVQFVPTSMARELQAAESEMMRQDVANNRVD